GGRTATRSLPFFVIFNPQEVNGEACFGFEETAIWFGSGTNSDQALTYSLHPDDQRIFGIAIAQVKGEIESYSSAKKLNDWVSGHWSYSLNYHTNDALELLLHHTSAQCADEACFLVALLRAVGIPAHPATADAGVEVGDANWNFDTWTEAKLTGAGKPVDWYVLHPHEYPSMQPTLRSHFAANYGVATKAQDDLIIMANCGWLSKISEVTDYTSDVTYGRNSCQEPNQTFNKIASWINHLCNPGYWGVGHWGCSPPDTTAIRIVIPIRARLRVGEVLNFQTIVMGVRAIEDTLAVRILSNDIRSHAWPDTVLTAFRYSLRLLRGDSTQFNYSYKIPGNLVTTNETVIEARAGEDRRYFIVQPVEIAPRFEWKLDLTKATKNEPRPMLILTLENVTGEAIHQVVARLKPPFGVTVEKPVQEIERILPLESVQIQWGLPGRVPTGIAMATIIVESRDGGIVETVRNIGQ
ncbi:MAG: transglutaminase-like domain-containing protein, partial [candidate division KSB1 bacterium]|nr:transglutaminase-like domain-containing protein [candidate division KSB1 bacterium]